MKKKQAVKRGKASPKGYAWAIPTLVQIGLVSPDSLVAILRYLWDSGRRAK